MEERTEQQSRKVLVIDDQAPVREAVEEVLAMVGIVVLAAEDGHMGIHMYQERKDEIDLVLLDLSMPGLSGQETLRQLRQINPAIKVILSSGYSEEEITKEFDYAKDFLQKPYNIDRLIDLVDQYLSSD